MPVSALADYTDEATRASCRPRSTLSLIATVVNLIHDALGVPSPARDHLYGRLRKAIRLRRTTQPVQKGLPVPPTLLVELFHRWGPNDALPLERLRAKLVALLAFLALLRPSDVTLPTVAQVAVPPAADRLVVCLLGFKNDYTAQGASVTIWRAADALLDPVSCYQCWLRRTRAMRPDQPGPSRVVIQLRRPYEGVKPATVSHILNEVIVAGGGDRSLLSARGFRRGGASWAIAREVMPDKILHLGRWASAKVFAQHYVQTGVDSNFTDLMFAPPPPPRAAGATAPLAATDLVQAVRPAPPPAPLPPGSPASSLSLSATPRHRPPRPVVVLDDDDGNDEASPSGDATSTPAAPPRRRTSRAPSAPRRRRSILWARPSDDDDENDEPDADSSSLPAGECF